jgi:orotate phosphoribosyltransferase
MQLPSGRVFDSLDEQIAQALARNKSIKVLDEPIILNCGKSSHIYVSLREDFTMHPDVGVLLARKILRQIKIIMDMDDDGRHPRLIGLPMAGTAIAVSAAIVDSLENITCRKACSLVMRPVQKKHGAHHTWLDARPDPQTYREFAIDNVLTKGGTVETSYARFAEDGFDTEGMHTIIVVDRQQSGLSKLARSGITRVSTLYNLRDLVPYYRELGIWSDTMADTAERELAA